MYVSSKIDDFGGTAPALSTLKSAIPPPSPPPLNLQSLGVIRGPCVNHDSTILRGRVKHINHAYHNTYSYKNIWAKRWIDATATTTRAPDRLMRSRRIDGTATTTRAPDRSMPRAKITQITVS